MKQKTLLYVEDNEDLRELVAGFLESEGFDVVAAASGKQALESLKSGFAPSLIMLDLSLPDMAAGDFSLAVKNLYFPAPCPPFIIASGKNDIAEWAIKLGAVGKLRKPFNLDELQALLHQHLL